MRQILLIFIPISTGLISAMWSRVISDSFVLNGILNCVIGAVTTVAMLAAGYKFPFSFSFSWAALFSYILLSVALTWVWMIVAIQDDGTSDPTPIALAEMAWPIFVALFMWQLYGTYTLSKVQVVGGGISFVGLLIIAFGR